MQVVFLIRDAEHWTMPKMDFEKLSGNYLGKVSWLVCLTIYIAPCVEVNTLIYSLASLH